MNVLPEICRKKLAKKGEIKISLPYILLHLSGNISAKIPSENGSCHWLTYIDSQFTLQNHLLYKCICFKFNVRYIIKVLHLNQE